MKIIRRDHESRSPTQAELGRKLAERYADVSEARRTSLLAARDRRNMPLVEFFPAIRGTLQPDPLGHLWVQEYRYPGQDRNVWTVFDADGRVQGFVETPPGLDVFEIGEDYILGLMTDAVRRGAPDVDNSALEARWAQDARQGTITEFLWGNPNWPDRSLRRDFTAQDATA